VASIWQVVLILPSIVQLHYVIALAEPSTRARLKMVISRPTIIKAAKGLACPKCTNTMRAAATISLSAYWVEKSAKCCGLIEFLARYPSSASVRQAKVINLMQHHALALAISHGSGT